jgi:Uma2 family endonuclease
LYGQPNIPELWIVNIPDRSIEVYRQPSDAGFRAISIVRGQQIVSPAAIPSISFSVDELFGQSGLSPTSLSLTRRSSLL